MPPLNGGDYLLTAWSDLGRVEVGGMGHFPLKYAEIAAGMPWTTAEERRTIRRMSEAYLAGGVTGRKTLGRAPWAG